MDDIENGILVLQAMKDVKIDKVEDGKVWISLTKEEILKEVNKSLALKDIGVLSFKREGSVEDVFSHISEVVT